MIDVTMTSELSQQRNDVITCFTCRRISRHREVYFFQNRSRQLVPPTPATKFLNFERNQSKRALSKYFGLKVQ